MTPLAQMPETGTGKVDTRSKLPSRSVSRAMRTVLMSPVPSGWIRISRRLDVFWQARLGVKLWLRSTVAIGCPLRPGVRYFSWIALLVEDFAREDSAAARARSSTDCASVLAEAIAAIGSNRRENERFTNDHRPQRREERRGGKEGRRTRRS